MFAKFKVSIKSLAGQTIWYGLSTILSRFIFFLVTPIIGGLATTIQGEYGAVYAPIAFLSIFFTFGMETTFFRFSRDYKVNDVFNTATSILLLISIPSALIIIFNRVYLSSLFSIPGKTTIVIYIALILLFDALSSMPFAQIRYDQRPRKFAFIKIMNVIINLLLTSLFVLFIPWLIKNNYANAILKWYQPEKALEYIVLANVIASASSFLFLTTELKAFRPMLHSQLWKPMLIYTLPLIIVGFGGMINEAFDRMMLPKLLPGSLNENLHTAGIYNQNYKLAALIIIFTQAFRMGAEPFFIKESNKANAQITYARIMNFFIIFCCIGFLCVVLFRDIWNVYIRTDVDPDRLKGFPVVILLLIAKIFYGIYYNLTIWFKLENKTSIGALITLIGAGITILINIIFIPHIGFYACGWASLACYTFMIAASYFLGQKYYPVPYQVGKGFLYLGIVVAMYYIFNALLPFMPYVSIRLFLGIVWLGLFFVLALFIDKKEFAGLPFVGTYVKKFFKV